MNTRRLLRRLRAAGFTLEVDGSDLVVRPAGNVTEWTEGLIQDRKTELLDLLERGVEFEEYPPCLDCSAPLPLGGVRHPACREAHPEPTCASCGTEIPGPDLSVCSLCSLEAARLTAEELDPSPREDQGPEPGVCRKCGTAEIGPSATICGRCRRRRWEAEGGGDG